MAFRILVMQRARGLARDQKPATPSLCASPRTHTAAQKVSLRRSRAASLLVCATRPSYRGRGPPVTRAAPFAVRIVCSGEINAKRTFSSRPRAWDRPRRNRRRGRNAQQQRVRVESGRGSTKAAAVVQAAVSSSLAASSLAPPSLAPSSLLAAPSPPPLVAGTTITAIITGTTTIAIIGIVHCGGGELHLAGIRSGDA